MRNYFVFTRVSLHIFFGKVKKTFWEGDNAHLMAKIPLPDSPYKKILSAKVRIVPAPLIVSSDILADTNTLHANLLRNLT